MKEKILKCPWCGTEFVSVTNGRIYCSVQCRRKAIHERNKHNLRTGICCQCGETFLAKGVKKYCSKECRDVANGRKKKRNVLTKTPSLTIEEVALLSRKAGMSYGEYVGKHGLK